MDNTVFDGPLFSGIIVFAQVAQSGSFVSAAERLGLSPSGVSRAIGRLEKRLGVRLLSRTTRVLTLTDDGRVLFEEARSHLDAVAEAAARAAGTADAVRGTLRVNIDPVFNHFVLAARLPDFLARFPDLNVELLMRDSVGDLIADRFDLAVRFGAPPVGRLVARRLAEARVLTVAAPVYLARHGMPSHPRDVPSHRLILLQNPETNRPHEWEFRCRSAVVQIPAKGPLLLSDAASMLAACVAGAGIAQILDWAAGDLLRRHALVNLFPDWHGERYPLFAVYPSRKYVAAKVRVFLEFCLLSLKDVGQPSLAPLPSRAIGRTRPRRRA